MFVLACYDSPNDRRRNRIARILLDYGYRVQKSVFEIDAPDNLLKEMTDRIKRSSDPEEDCVRFYHLCRRCLEQSELIGQKAELTNTETVFII